jgi:hypothetical protein
MGGKIAISGCLVSLRGPLVGVGQSLVLIGRALVRVRDGLIGVSRGLIRGGSRLIGLLPSSMPSPADTRSLSLLGQLKPA